MIRLGTADDQELVRSGLRLVLEARGIEVVAEASDGREAVLAVQQSRPEVTLMDIRMPRLDGIAAIRQLTKVGERAKVLVHRLQPGPLRLRRAQGGHRRLPAEATPPDRLVGGIRTVAAGESLLAPSLTKRLIMEHVQPTPARRADRRLLDGEVDSPARWPGIPPRCSTAAREGRVGSPSTSSGRVEAGQGAAASPLPSMLSAE
jgi:DNA-binding NarL/FixJ family response regulator